MKNAQWENVINLVLGVWLFLTPWTISSNLTPYASMMTNWNVWIVGVAIVFSASMALQNLKPWEEWTNLVLGIWMILSPWLFGYSGEAALMWNSLIVGAVIAVLSAIALPVAQKLQVR